MKLVDLIIYTGIFFFAVTGALKARTHRMDIFGGCVMGFVTAYGGGTVRDLLIGIRPINWINDYFAFSLVTGAVIITFLFKPNFNKFQRIVFYTDAIGLGMFTAAGIERSLAHGINDLYAVLMGVITATFGGFVADIISNNVPALLRRGELYATASAIGGGVYIALQHYKIGDEADLFICVVVVVLIRVISMRKRITLPEL
ncbi:trimeric intracellular cation channel family protein [Deminuibacter soli]|uniref:Trimeric intracellular cation channel family protein n=1 Tax=Deminuibacter soli TaxID=2291815 RepID=A0A3E1NP44_9BACT|nr:trimeric intracellular cation channel family protein [Deminuibacter soli]RFM29690.1 trimeric intracellular cation channel family protein [Deminuibacter soli]